MDLIVDAIHRNEFGLPKTRVVHLVDGIWHEGRTVLPPLRSRTSHATRALTRRPERPAPLLSVPLSLVIPHR